MNNIFKPHWIFICNTIPALLLILIHVYEFQIIQTLLSEESLDFWKQFSLIFGIYFFANIIYCIYLSVNKKTISIVYHFILLLSSITLIFYYYSNANVILPFSIPRWMVSRDFIHYIFTFLMPSIGFTLFSIVVATTQDVSEKAYKSFIFATGIPFVWYILTEILSRFTNLDIAADFSLLFITLAILSVLFFLYFLIRTLLVYVQSKTRSDEESYLVWKVIITLVLPILGLLVNHGIIFDFGSVNDGIFGNFNTPLVYSLTFLNSLFLCLPNTKIAKWRLILFILRSLTFTFSLYFFIVFLPFLPFSIIAILAIGSGFLMLSPLALFVIHIHTLYEDIIFLKSTYSTRTIRFSILCSFLIIPTAITIDYYNTKLNLEKTLEYVYTPNYETEYSIDKTSLKETIDIVKSHKSRRFNNVFENKLPYLSTYFNWLVLDNLTLSNSKIKSIETLFFGKSETFVRRPRQNNNQSVKITSVTNSSVYDENQGAWKSWINLELTNQSNNRLSEFTTHFNLPTGAWVSDYYLYVGDKKEMGILSEKKSAMWIYSQITAGSRDPGILFYRPDNQIAFRVFPFDSLEVRKTGIEIIHQEPFTFNILDQSVVLGDSIYSDKRRTKLVNDNVIYISSKEKKNLKTISRKPYFHFVIDVSQPDQLNSYKKRMQTILNNPAYHNLIQNSKVSFVNHQVKTFDMNANWNDYIEQLDSNEGFFLERAFDKIYFNAYKTQSETYPIITIITDNINQAILSNEISKWDFANPENALFFNTTPKGDLIPHKQTAYNPKEPISSIHGMAFKNQVLEYKMPNNTMRYISTQSSPSMVLKEDIFDLNSASILEKDWNSGLLLSGKMRSQILHPEQSNSEWFQLVKNSFKSKIMTPYTSYLVVENEAQKAMLKRKQNQYLNSNKSLDIGEETLQMSEPNLYLLLLLFGGFLFLRFRNVKR